MVTSLEPSATYRALFDYDPATMSPNKFASRDELKFKVKWRPKKEKKFLVANYSLLVSFFVCHKAVVRGFETSKNFKFAS